MAHPLEGFWLARRIIRDHDSDPFSSVIDLDDQERAFQLVRLAGKIVPDTYFDTRRQVEAWLRANAMAKGIKPDDKPPLYFRLYPQPFTPETTPHTTYINIPANSLPTNSTTYTFEDSFHHHAQLQGQPYPHTPSDLVPEVYTAHQVQAHIDAQGFPADLDGRDPTRYIECQVWDRQLPALTLARRLGHNALTSHAFVLSES